ncbi:MAG: late competence development ComFB family protein [Defluviitaleaceae bacterium]|nr:late competence development ComFB family protein [Defluviitaleaceae bacterium]
MYQINNYMETCVQDIIKSVLKEINSCQCDKCTTDILAIALNSLPPKYVVTRKGELYSKLETLRQQFDVDIIAAITKAAVIVNRSPRHDKLD